MFPVYIFYKEFVDAVIVYCLHESWDFDRIKRFKSNGRYKYESGLKQAEHALYTEFERVPNNEKTCTCRIFHNLRVIAINVLQDFVKTFLTI